MFNVLGRRVAPAPLTTTGVAKFFGVTHGDQCEGRAERLFHDLLEFLVAKDNIGGVKVAGGALVVFRAHWTDSMGRSAREPDIT